MINTNSVVAVYESHDAAQEAIEALRKAGTDVRRLSIVGRGYHTEEQVTGYYNTGDRMKYWGKFGAFWGGLWGLLVGVALFVVPGIGPVLVAGPFAAAVIGALEGAAVVGGVGALGAGLFSLGIPRNSVLQYETAIKADKFLLIMHGTAEEVGRAHDVLSTTRASAVETHEAEGAASVEAKEPVAEVPVGAADRK